MKKCYHFVLQLATPSWTFIELNSCFHEKNESLIWTICLSVILCHSTFTFHKKSGSAVDMEGKFQTNLQAKSISFLVWKFRSIISTHFSPIFWRICRMHCFLNTVAVISKSWHIWIAIFASNYNSNMSASWNGSNSV